MSLPRLPVDPAEEDDEAERAIIAQIQAKQRRRAALRQAGTPEVGLFWVTKALGKFRLLSRSTPWPEAQQMMEYWVQEHAHIEEWPGYKIKYELEGGWADWPRGRVIYHQPTRQFTVYADVQLLTPYYKRHLLREFSLPPDATTFLPDPHYDSKLQIPLSLDPAKEAPTL
ncbi:hypothetical protein V5F44_07425 [Xanthobacter sp. V2C-8]|uniref:hypothetical protein n=1 Tax=Xanthobacter albus TaxID=3119929 RepID=UPI003726F8B2